MKFQLNKNVADSGKSLYIEQLVSLTCPYCTRMDFIEAISQEYVACDHSDTTLEVMCLVCALHFGSGESNRNDFANHLILEHRSGPRYLISYLDNPKFSRHGPRRLLHSSCDIGGHWTRRYSKYKIIDYD
ncbi:E3 ubiquitin-protein ligase Kcmf1-like isoform X2 [Cotesia typhae]|uniref:E3 ubiquitin-protein ligase Kcmf1-like isoform X2 n=1 Tax=Cotesia typhae TaxID=2053667 RepID=UPI003D6904D1